MKIGESKGQAEFGMMQLYALSHSFSKCIFLVAQFSAAFVAPYSIPPFGNLMEKPSRQAAAEPIGMKRGEALFLRRPYTAWNRTIVPVTLTWKRNAHAPLNNRGKG